MIKIKVTNDYPHWNILRQTPSEKGIWGNCQFFVNKNDVKECDFWIVHSGLLEKEECLCPKENIILITGEASDARSYKPEFLKQFPLIFTVQEDLEKYSSVIRSHHMHPYLYGQWIGYDQLSSISAYKKTKLISVISSNLQIIEGHRKRFNFVTKLKQRLGDKIDWFGHGVNFMQDKWEAIAEYKYHIAIENQFCDYYWTEKLGDTFLGGAYPIYYGCPNAEMYFSKNAFSRINIDDLEESIKTIEKIIEENTYEKSLEAIWTAREQVLNKHQLFAVMSEYCTSKYSPNAIKEKVILMPEFPLALKRKVKNKLLSFAKKVKNKLLN